MNHSDIRGSEPHVHDSSGAASLYGREFETGVVHRIEASRMLLSTSADQITVLGRETSLTPPVFEESPPHHTPQRLEH